MDDIILISLATIPPIGILFYFILNDEKKDRNFTFSFYGFFAGGLLAIPVVLTQSFLIDNIFKENAFTYTYLIAGLVEESFKLLALLLVVGSNLKIDDEDIFGVILISIAVSLGFATIENIIYVINGGFSVAIFRGLFTIPLHASCGAILVICMSVYNKKFSTSVNILKGLFFAILLHGTYNFLLAIAPNYVAFVLIIGVVIWLLSLLENINLYSINEKLDFGNGKILNQDEFLQDEFDSLYENSIYFFIVAVILLIMIYLGIIENLLSLIQEILESDIAKNIKGILTG